MNKRAQSIVEYTLIAVLVILGIVYMGPYVLRSIGAHFKLWDYSVQDSFSENLTQAPVNSVPTIPITCKCQNIPGSCGTGGGQGSCQFGYRIINHSCDPQLCDGAPASTCVYDPTCCTAYNKAGCGTIACPAGGCSGLPTTPLPTPPSTSPLNNCYVGQRIWATYCSSLPVECEDDPTCAPTCLGVVSPGALFCATQSTTPPTTGLTSNTDITYVSNCTSPFACQAYCGPGYVLNGTPPNATGCLADFIVALPPADTTGYAQYGAYVPSKFVTQTNNQSFSICATANQTITNVTVAAVPPPVNPTEGSGPLPYCGGRHQCPNGYTIPVSPVIGDGCQNYGEPGQQCHVTIYTSLKN